ncbi:glycosyltransferase [Eubacterium sp. An11]|uniref:glycosyltransferase n=1 Tax=Eubacterium sp. An11 TaxID=1965542 RepID=UPI0013A64CEE|nr:glycosyltransferase [Eubacterium sp. An11]
MQLRLMILITNYFPFYKGEEYLENEINIASENFDKILIIPTMIDDRMNQTRTIPSNVEILKINVDCSIHGKIKMIFHEAINVATKTKWIEVIRRETGINPKKIGYYFYYLCRTEYVYRLISNDINFNRIVKKIKNIILYSYWMHITASVAARLKDRFFHDKIKCITRGHRYDLYEYAAPCGFVPDRYYMLKQMDAVYPCSEDGAAYIRKYFPEYCNKVSVQRLGTNRHEQVSCSRTPIFHLVSCSVIRKVKRLDKIVAVIVDLLNKGYFIKWTHLGGGPEFNNIKKVITETLPSESFCLMGQMKNQDIIKWYMSNAVSCFINLSDSEGVPVAIMEAMSFGIPIVATDVGGSREIVLNGKNGYLVSRDSSIKAISKCLEDIILMEEGNYNSLCKNSFKIWDERSNAKKLYEMFYIQLRNFLNEK